MPAIGFQPPPPSSRFAAFRDPDDATSIIVKPVDYFVLWGPVNTESPSAAKFIGFSVTDGPLSQIDNFLGYAEDQVEAVKRYAPTP